MTQLNDDEIEVGLLWYDDDPGRDLRSKAMRAIRRFKRKYGRDPVSCYVHPRMLGDRLYRRVLGVIVKRNPYVLPHHFWVIERRPTSERT